MGKLGFSDDEEEESETSWREQEEENTENEQNRSWFDELEEKARARENEFKPVIRRKRKKYVKFAETDKCIHEAQSYTTRNKFNELSDENKSEKTLGGKWEGIPATSIKLLSRIPNATIGSCSEGPQKQWRLVSMAVDSGACETVADPGQIPCEVKETDASRRGACFASATGEAIPNMGEMTMPVMTREGSFRRMRVQAAPVTKPLASVLRIVQAGHTVVFDSRGSYIRNKCTGEINVLREEDGNYMLDMWIPPMEKKNEAEGFPRPS